MICHNCRNGKHPDDKDKKCCDCQHRVNPKKAPRVEASQRVQPVDA